MELQDKDATAFRQPNNFKCLALPIRRSQKSISEYFELEVWVVFDTADERYKKIVNANKIVFSSNVFIAFQASMLS